MEKITDLRVHIAPLGFEIDRVVIPAEIRRADIVWLMIPPNNVLVRGFLDKVKEQLTKLNIAVKEKLHDRMDLFDIIRATREIIQDEESNNIFVNLSSGSKIQAVGCMMACMTFANRDGIYPYYVEPEAYYERPEDAPLSHGVKDVIDLPQYEIRIPNDLLVKAMDIIRSQPSGRIKKSILVRRLVETGVLHVKDNSFMSIDDTTREYPPVSIGSLAALNNNIMRPLQRWKFVNVEKVGRSQWVSLTDAGANAARFLGKS